MDKTTVNEIIRFLKQALVNNGVKVESIALFGSALKGNMSDDSDIDLIIVSPDFQNLDIFERAKITMHSEIATMKKFKVPMDVLNYSPAEFNSSSLKIFNQCKIVA